MHALDIFFNTICCNLFLLVSAFFFIHQLETKHPGKLFVSPIFLRAVAITYCSVCCLPAVMSRLPHAAFVFMYSSTLLPAIAALLMFKGRSRWLISGGFLFFSIYFLMCAWYSLMDILHPESMFQ